MNNNVSLLRRVKATRPMKIWKAINEVFSNSKSSTPQFIVSNGVQHADPKAIATILNSFFVSVGKTLAYKFRCFCSNFSKPKEVGIFLFERNR